MSTVAVNKQYHFMLHSPVNCGQTACVERLFRAVERHLCPCKRQALVDAAHRSLASNHAAVVQLQVPRLPPWLP